jgi:hypothetical protein
LIRLQRALLPRKTARSQRIEQIVEEDSSGVVIVDNRKGGTPGIQIYFPVLRYLPGLGARARTYADAVPLLVGT